MAINDRLVYIHRKKTDGTPFYVGIGDLVRAKTIGARSDFWKRTVSKYGYTIHIVAENLSREEACELECFLIQEYSRRILNEGPLINISPRGDGLSDPAIRTKEWCNNISKGLTGKKLSESHKKKLSLAKKGKQSNNRRKLINIKTGKIYDSVTIAAKAIGMSRSSLTNRLCGITVNNTNLKYYEYK